MFMLMYTNAEIINILRKEGAFSEKSVDAEDPYKAPIRLNGRDIKNLRHRARMRLLKGRSPTTVLLMGLLGWDILWKKVSGDSNHALYVFCASYTGLEILARFHSLFWIDAIYKTNCFKMPMVNIVGKSATGKTFFVACAFISNEKEGSY